jgi:glutathione synthase/RimK-type ligase-like ATP-grasp enzyme
MSKTVLINRENIAKSLHQLSTDWVVMKPINGLKGLGVFIGSKAQASQFTIPVNSTYIVQEFIETNHGIPGITNRRHDLRIVIINGKPVWSHVRIPPEGEYKANMSGREGGILKEILIKDAPSSVLEIVGNVAQKFLNKYDNPIYSLDFGFDEEGKPWLFEINDQIGFPTPKMKAKDLFLEELVKNFASKL